MIQPLEQMPPGEETLVESAHDLRITGAGLDRRAILTASVSLHHLIFLVNQRKDSLLV